MLPFPRSLTRLAALLLWPAAVLAQAAPPPAPVRPVTDVYHGVELVDPYRWLENREDPETMAWMRAQAEYADRYLQALPDRQAISDALQAPAAADTVIRGVQEAGGRWFYLRRVAYLVSEGGREDPETRVFDLEQPPAAAASRHRLRPASTLPRSAPRHTR